MTCGGGLIGGAGLILSYCAPNIYYLYVTLGIITGQNYGRKNDFKKSFLATVNFWG